ncbi:UDP-N-acetylglucosamine 2-epimerase (hydrolyzing) [Psychrosphaera sp. B3R10]|uniref:UDP-N-acetylglucosamine 2-epimerase n=1 Tax=unclassified Psychrosphaera TaxID=2641570 RepID=UPI001C08A958|nr:MULTISPECIES: UDP-N-acetylglucosamine 2-epimerase [unclassified Psychrosphaera]MBU2881828.1 UDP-N-acetylglucosamine 2-epimerase (hydrolyzing) [Psychrosphaera sp. I2R16]MBU2989200.1 UDP-N-acetylglucosamine 2-epimerase (hydrolyzing) [Psychrosphaera sp. B3R10]MDO6719984.1 UDP-N-acetylglucosamine 2-epimerase [Psychrosphaera sp. 1_MG-2023]
MKNVAVFTGTRAEYGLLYWLIKDIENDPELKLNLLVSGTHLSPEFGLTFKQIEDDGFFIDEKVEMLLSSDTAIGVAKSIGLGVLGYTDALSRMQPDILIVLGDRYEALAVAQTAMILRVPILHLHGGEITEGAYDDAIRHAITKLSYLHATSTDEHRKRVVQLGEDPTRVFNVGAIGLDSIKRADFMSIEELSASLSFKIDRPYFILTYHPVTLGEELPISSFEAILDALDCFKNYQVIITYPNADDGGRKIIPMIEEYANSNVSRVLAIPSLGHKRYLSAVKNCAAVIGNSSSGIIEVPSFGKPTVNVGVRQNGRLAAKSVIHSDIKFESLKEAINKAVTMPSDSSRFINPYGKGDASKAVIEMVKSLEFNPCKKFFNIE